MSVLVTVADLRVQLRLPASATGEEGYLQSLIDAARGSCARHLDRRLSDLDLTADDLAVIRTAVLVWATALYEDRAGDGEVPRSVVSLLRPLKSMAR